MWFLLREGMYASRRGGRSRRAGRTTWSGGWAAIWIVAIGTTGIYLMVKHPAAGIAVGVGFGFLVLFGAIIGSANRQAKAERATASDKAQRDALDSLMARYEAEDEARKAQRRAAFAALNEHAQKGPQR